MQKNRNWATILFEKILSDQYTFKSAIGMFQKNVFAIKTFSQLDASQQRKNIYSLFMRWYKRACGPLDFFLQESWCIDLVYSGVPAGPVGVPSWSNCQPASRHAIIVPWCGWARCNQWTCLQLDIYIWTAGNFISDSYENHNWAETSLLQRNQFEKYI